MDKKFAEEKIRQSKPKKATAPTTDVDFLRRIHELEVRQIELEMQNKELLHSRVETEETLRQYENLYVFAPIGYFTLAQDGEILLVNQKGAALLGMESNELLKRCFDGLVSEPSRVTCQEFLRKAFANRQKETCEVALQKDDQAPFWVQLEANSEDGQVCLVAVIDINEARQTKEALSRSEARYRGLFINALDAILLADDNGHYIDVNPSACQQLGYTREQLLSMNIWDITPEANQEQGLALWKNFIEMGTLSGEYIITRRDGEKVYFEFRAVANILPGIHHSIMHDITERKQAQKALEKSEVNLREAHRIARMGSWELKLPGGNREWSEGIYTLLELAPGTAPSNDIFRELIHPEDRPKMDDAFKQAIQNKTPFQLIHRLLMPDGHIKWINDICHLDYDAQGNLNRITGILYDITEFKHAEEQSHLQSAALEAVANGVMITDRDGIIQWVNPAFTQITGYSLFEAMGNTPRLLKSGEQPPDFYSKLWAKITAGETWHGEMVDRHKDGSLITIEQFIAPVRDAQNVVTHFVVSMTDVSERVQTQQQLSLQSAALEAADNAIAITDRGGYIEWVNPALALLTGYSRDETIGAHTRIFKSNTHLAAFYTDLWSTIRAGKVWRGQLVNRRKNGEHYHEEMTITPVMNAKNEITHFIAIKQDISQRVKAEIELQQYADEQAALFMVTAASASQVDPADLLSTTLETILSIPHLHVSCGWVLLFDDKMKKVSIGASSNVSKAFLAAEVNSHSALCLRCVQFAEKEIAKVEEIQISECGRIPQHVLEKEGLQAHIGIPLKIGKQALGVLNLGWREVYPYSESYYAMLDSIGKQVSLALQHARLYQEALQVDRLKIINQIGLEINASIELDTVFRNMLNLTYRALHGQEGSILLIDAQSGDLVIRHTLTVLSQRLRGKGIKKGHGLAGWVVENKQSALVNDVQHDPRWNSEFDNASGFRTDSILCAPLIHNGNVIGVIEIINSQHGGFTREDKSLLDAIAPMAAVAIQNARLFTSTRQRAEELDTINHIVNAITSSLDSRIIISNALIRIQQQFAAVFVGLMEQDKTNGELVLKDALFSDKTADANSLRFKPDQSFLVMRAIQARQPILKTDLMTDLETAETLPVLTHYAHALMIMPMSVADHAIGSLIIASNEVGRYDENDLLVLQSIAAALSMALENARLYEDLKQVLAERERVQAQLIQSEKASALGRLAATVAHEINNPLQAIQGCLGLFGEEMQARNRPEKLNRYIEIVGSEIERIAAIVQRMRDFYRPMNAVMQPTQIWQVVQAILDLSSKQLQHSSVKVEFVWDDKLPLVQANADHLKQVFLNLIINAVDAMPQGGTLRVAIEKASMPRPGENGQEIAALKVSIADSGQGIPSDELTHLYEPFFTTKPNGTGLGLYVSLNIIQAHGGKIEIISLPGKGTTFEIFIPTVRANSP